MNKTNNAIADRKNERIKSEILNILNNTLKYNLNNKDLKFVSFTYVKLTDDRSTVFVLVDTYDRSKIDSMVSKLNEAKGFFRKALAEHMNMKKVPTIIFEKDKVIDSTRKIDEILIKINKGGSL
ncbi:MAG: 30S ribosome-binding factor RbfA [Mycoplasmataceae bacterium]|jgi:ribosome-binding factor A|nr:30S ribosome-binding factor RbfA [Mycoplasmataceae bacterium]